MLFLVHVDGDASAVVDDGDGVVFVDGHFDVAGISREGFVDGVVDNFIHKVMEALFRNVAYVHCRAFAHGLQSFQHLNITGAVFFVSL